MSILDGVLGGIVSAGITAVVKSVLEQHGGVQGLVGQFEKNGLGAIAQSWVGTGANQPVDAGQLHQALGADLLSTLASKTGMSVDDLTSQLVKLLPETVDKMTPEGKIPTTEAA